MSIEIMEKVSGALLRETERDITADQITRETQLNADLGLDSMQGVTLMMDCEEEFGISVTDDEISALRTVGDIVDIIERKRGES